jgi:hypothetical protein
MIFELLLPFFPAFLALGLGAVQETDWIEVFRAGDYPQGTFTDGDVEEIAARYDPDYLEAPVTTDHAQTGPAFGWVQDVKAEGKRLLVRFRQLSEQMAEAINEGLFKNRSVELFGDLGGEGPYLKAVSFLGAQTPQVKGLEPIGDIEFSKKQLQAASASFAYHPEGEADDGEDGQQSGDEEAEKDKEAFAEQTESEQTDSEQGDPQDEQTDSQEGDSEQDEELDVSKVDTFAEMKQAVAQMQSQLQSERAQRRAAEERAEEAEAAGREEAFESFLSERVPPAIRPRAKAIYRALREEPITFDHAGEEVEEDPAAAFKQLLASLDHEDLFEEAADEEPSRTQFSNGADEFTEAVREEMTANGTF